MLTWHIDRAFRSGPLCALATFVIPAAMAILINAISETENVLGIVLIASGFMVIGSLIGSVVTSGLGALLFSFGAFVAELPIALMAVIGCTLFATMLLHDLAGLFHRAPKISPAVWRNAAGVWVGISAVSAAVFAISYSVANLATWQTIVVPFGVAAIGFAAKLAADSHAETARTLTAKRKPPDQ